MTKLLDYLLLPAPWGGIGVELEQHRVRAVDLIPEVGREPSIGLDQRDLATDCASQFAAWFKDPSFAFTLPLEIRGTEFQQRVWRRLPMIPRGQTRRYGELAAELGSGARAIGGACRANPLPIILPCHRVVATNGLGGFSGASGGKKLDMKRWLLRHEHALA